MKWKKAMRQNTQKNPTKFSKCGVSFCFSTRFSIYCSCLVAFIFRCSFPRASSSEKRSFWFPICAPDLHASRSHATTLQQPIANCWPVGSPPKQFCLPTRSGKPHAWPQHDVFKTDPSERPKTSQEVCKYPLRTTSRKRLQSEEDDG